MKTLFSVGFQSNNPFTVRHPSLKGASSQGRAIPLMGQETSEFEHIADAEAQANADLRAKLSAIITKGNQKLAQVNAWIQTQYTKDPTLLATFKEQYVAENWRGYDDIVTKDQSYVDLAAQKIASQDPRNWDFSEDMIGRVQEWDQVIDIMVAGMQQYGGIKATIPNKLAPLTKITGVTGAPIQTRIAPGATITTPPPAEGISPKTLLIGGGVLAAVVGLVLALKA